MIIPSENENQAENGVKSPTLNIVLVEPQIPQNTGNISRTCAATGARLHLIEPMAFKITDRNLKRAGLDYWHLLDIKTHQNLDEFYEHVKAESENPAFFYFTTKGGIIHSDADYSLDKDCYLFFGKETAGLPVALLKANRDHCVRMPMLNDDTARSLNLSNAVAIGVYEVLRQWGYPSLRTAGKME